MNVSVNCKHPSRKNWWYSEIFWHALFRITKYSIPQIISLPLTTLFLIYTACYVNKILLSRFRLKAFRNTSFEKKGRVQQSLKRECIMKKFAIKQHSNIINVASTKHTAPTPISFLINMTIRLKIRPCASAFAELIKCHLNYDYKSKRETKFVLHHNITMI